MAKHRILVVDDEINIRRLVTYNLEKNGYTCDTADDGSVALERIRENPYDVIILDLNMPVMDGLEVLKTVTKSHPDCPVVMVTANHELTVAIDCMKNGAWDYITKPIDFTRLNAIIKNAIENGGLKREINELQKVVILNTAGFGLIGSGEATHGLIALASQVATTELTVLITGESGTGKEMLARAIHQSGKRRKGPWVAVNSAAIPAELADSLLFGHKKGAFTGAQEDRAGYFEQADGGTLFLDEIGDMPPDIQAKLLRTLQEKTVRRVGEKQERPVNFRVIAATNVDLKEKIARQSFRQDLYYRLEEFPLQIPPLRDRKEDIPELSTHFLRQVCEEHDWPVKTISDPAMNSLMAHSWPGNIRELRNVIRRSAVYAAGSILDQIRLDPAMRLPSPVAPATNPSADTRLQDVEAETIRKAVEANPGNLSEAARQLGISRATLYRKLKNDR